MRWLALTAALALPLTTAACGEKDVAKSSIAAWNKWSKSNEVPGTEIVSHTGDGKLKFTGRFRVNAKLTAKPTEESVKASISGLCGFNKVSPAEVEYLLQVRKLTLQLPCDTEKNAKVVAFWKAVGPLPGLAKASLTTEDTSAAAVDRKAMALVAPTALQALAATGLVGSSQKITITSPDLRITSDLDTGLTTNLGALKHFFKMNPPGATSVEMAADTVAVQTKGNPADAASLQRRLIGGSPAGVAVNVFPAKPTAIDRAEVSTEARDLVRTLGGNSQVIGVYLSDDGLQVNAANVDAMRALYRELADNNVATGQGRLVMTSGNTSGCRFEIGPEGEGRQLANSVMSICSLPETVTMDTTETTEIRFRSDKIKPLMETIHALPPYTEYTITVLGPKGRALDTLTFKTGRNLDFIAEAKPALTDKARNLWAAMPVQKKVLSDERRSSVIAANEARRNSH